MILLTRKPGRSDKSRPEEQTWVLSSGSDKGLYTKLTKLFILSNSGSILATPLNSDIDYISVNNLINIVFEDFQKKNSGKVSGPSLNTNLYWKKIEKELYAVYGNPDFTNLRFVVISERAIHKKNRKWVKKNKQGVKDMCSDKIFDKGWILSTSGNLPSRISTVFELTDQNYDGWVEFSVTVKKKDMKFMLAHFLKTFSEKSLVSGRVTYIVNGVLDEEPWTWKRITAGKFLLSGPKTSFFLLKSTEYKMLLNTYKTKWKNTQNELCSFL